MPLLNPRRMVEASSKGAVRFSTGGQKRTPFSNNSGFAQTPRAPVPPYRFHMCSQLYSRPPSTLGSRAKERDRQVAGHVVLPLFGISSGGDPTSSTQIPTNTHESAPPTIGEAHQTSCSDPRININEAARF